jgi:hypothetical protein
MSTITKEQAQSVSDLKAGYTLGHADVAILNELARIALASLEAEAVAYIIQDKADRKEGNRGQLSFKSVEQYHEKDINEHELTATPLYTAPPATVSVPDEIEPTVEAIKRVLPTSNPDEYAACIGADMWNACRDAMLQGANERHVVRSEHAEWSQSTFGDVGPVGPLKHLSKEALEAAAEPGDLSEWADMQFLLWDAQRRAGITDEQITLAMIEKLAVNKSRTWPEPKDGEPRLHIKAGPQQEVK